MPKFLKQISPTEVGLVEGPIPEPNAEQIVVKVTIVGGNPVDQELFQYSPSVGSTIGCECAGIVHSVGSAVTRLKPGDRVAGYIMGNNPNHPEWGTFGEYSLLFEHTTFKIPDGMTDEEAVTLPAAASVAALGLGDLGMTGQGPDGKPIFINGGATNMGAVVIQHVKLIGATPIVTTGSPKNFGYLKSLGADHVFDYRDPEHISKIKGLFGDSLTRVFDAHSRGNSFELCSQLISSKGGDCVLLNQPTGSLREDVKYHFVNTFLVFGEALRVFGLDMPAVPELKEAVRPWIEKAPKLKPHTYNVLPGGLLGYKKGWEMYAAGTASGKLIYRVAETEGL